MPPDLDVLKHGEVPEQLHQLEGAHQPARSDVFRRNAGQLLVLEEDAACGGVEEPGDHIEQRRLAGAVGADDGGDTLRGNLEAHVVDREQAVETARQFLDTQAVHGSTLAGASLVTASARAARVRFGQPSAASPPGA
jgi:hypothetical protein